MRSAKLYDESYLKLERLRVHLMSRRKRTITKAALLDTLISLYSDALTKTKEGENDGAKI